MLTEIGLVGYGVEGGWVGFGECGVGVGAVETFLETIDPDTDELIDEALDNKRQKEADGEKVVD